MDIEREKLILKVIAGQATREEVQELTAWLDANPDQKDEFEAMKIMISQEASLRENEPDPAKMAFAKLEATRKHRIKLVTLRNQAAVFLLVLLAVTSTLLLLDLYTHTPKTSDDFVFADASFAEIKEIVERQMGVEIRIETPAILSCRFTGAFPASATVKDVLEGITYQTGVNVEKTEGGYVLRGRGCGVAP